MTRYDEALNGRLLDRLTGPLEPEELDRVLEQLAENDRQYPGWRAFEAREGGFHYCIQWKLPREEWMHAGSSSLPYHSEEMCRGTFENLVEMSPGYDVRMLRLSDMEAVLEHRAED